MANDSPLNNVLVDIAKKSKSVTNRMDEADGVENFGVFTAQKTAVFADSPYAITPYDGMVFVDTTAGAVTVVLPTAVGIGGREFEVCDKGNAIANSITIATTGGELINGAATYTINTSYAGVTVKSDGSNWYCR